MLHSATPSSPCTQDLDKTQAETRVMSEDGDMDRMIYIRALHGHNFPPIETEDPDRIMISVFDQ